MASYTLHTSFCSSSTQTNQVIEEKKEFAFFRPKKKKLNSQTKTKTKTLNLLSHTSLSHSIFFCFLPKKTHIQNQEAIIIRKRKKISSINLIIMSCNGCRVLRKGCSETCVLRSCLQWIDSPEAQGHATLFLAKFFGRSDLLSFVSSVPDHQRPALFRSLLFEACGRTVNPVNGAVGLLSSGNWHVCQTAVETVLAGGVLRRMQGILTPTMARPHAQALNESSSVPIPNRRQYYYPLSSFPRQDYQSQTLNTSSVASPNLLRGGGGSASASAMQRLRREHHTISLSYEESVTATSFGLGDRKERKLLNLFV